MVRGKEYRRLIHEFFDGRITRVELTERVLALGQRQMSLFLQPFDRLRANGSEDRAADTSQAHTAGTRSLLTPSAALNHEDYSRR